LKESLAIRINDPISSFWLAGIKYNYMDFLDTLNLKTF
jgi:hypothetical protein